MLLTRLLGKITVFFLYRVATARRFSSTGKPARKNNVTSPQRVDAWFLLRNHFSI